MWLADEGWVVGMGRLHRYCTCMQGVHGGSAARARSVLGQFKLTCIWVRSLTFSGCISLETRDIQTYSYVRHQAGGNLCPTKPALEVVGPPMMTVWLLSAEPTSRSRLLLFIANGRPITSPPAGALFLWLTLGLLFRPLAVLTQRSVLTHEFVWTWRVLGGQQNRPWGVLSG